MAHDITADRSPLVHSADPDSVRNYRTPRANLECVYGGGPVGSPYLYDRDDPALLLLGEGGHDVPRNAQGIALVGDARNDVHLFMNQLQVAFVRAHNLLVRRLRDDGEPEASVFEEARAALTWHYQFVLLHDFLPTLVGEPLIDELLRDGATHYRLDGEPYIPFEFADAAYRYGHSQIRHRYRVNADQPELPLFPDLMGSGPVSPEMAVDWSLLFDVPARPPAQRAKRIDGRLPASLINLPVAITGAVEDDAYHSLAARDLQRGHATGLPSGEAVARELGVEPLSADEVGLAEHGWEGETPLWFYVLREASERASGDRLGEVGGADRRRGAGRDRRLGSAGVQGRGPGVEADPAERGPRPLPARRPAAGGRARRGLAAGCRGRGAQARAWASGSGTPSFDSSDGS